MSAHGEVVNPRLVCLSPDISEHNLASRSLSDHDPLADHCIKESEHVGIQREASYTRIDSPGILRRQQGNPWRLD